MTDKEYNTQKARIRILFKRWRSLLGLSGWQINHNFFDDTGYFQDKDASLNGESAPGCLAFTTVSWEYLEASIFWNLPSILPLTDPELEDVLVHECTHILLKEMQAWKSCDCPHDMRHEERVCTTIARAFVQTKDYHQKTRPSSLPKNGKNRG